jgi:hypothetical protein
MFVAVQRIQLFMFCPLVVVPALLFQPVRVFFRVLETGSSAHAKSKMRGMESEKNGQKTQCWGPR